MMGTHVKITTSHVVGILIAALSLVNAYAQSEATVNPVLIFTGTEDYEAGGKQWTRYRYRVDNMTSFPEEIFAPSPELPPCGTNTNSSRTWVDFYQESGERLNGFCALNRDGLDNIWFGMEKGSIPPSRVYIKMADRKTGINYKSNLADTTVNVIPPTGTSPRSGRPPQN